MSLQLLPVELHWEVASHLDDDRDVANYLLICRATNDALEEPSKNFWRKRFNKAFDTLDLPAGSTATGKTLQKKYQERLVIIKRTVKLGLGNTQPELEVLNLLRNLITEAKFKIVDEEYILSNNYEHIATIIDNTNILRSIGRYNFKYKMSRLLQAVQLVLGARFLDPRYEYAQVGFPKAQRDVYAGLRRAPIFTSASGLNGPKYAVNIPWLLSVLNFFKVHLTDLGEHTMASAYRMLSATERPLMWNEHLKTGSKKLGRWWKGTYSYLDREEQPLCRNRDPHALNNGKTFQDKNIDEGETAIQRLIIDFPATFERPWNPMFEHYLHSVSQQQQPQVPTHAPATTTSKRTTRSRKAAAVVPAPDYTGFERAKHTNLRFIGKGYDDEDFLSDGWLNPLPPQEGIPGWQRMSMMKYFSDNNGNIDNEALWAYEGVVLPGGQLMLGRWWSVDEGLSDGEIYSGPFILWNIDASAPGEDFLDAPSDSEYDYEDDYEEEEESDHDVFFISHTSAGVSTSTVPIQLP